MFWYSSKMNRTAHGTHKEQLYCPLWVPCLTPTPKIIFRGVHPEFTATSRQRVGV